MAIYVTRTSALRRRSRQEKEMIDFCEQNNIACIDAAGLEVIDQIVFFSKARLIIGIHGAGLTNMVWMQPGSHVVEIVAQGITEHLYYKLSLATGHHYWVVPAKPSDPEKRNDSDLDVQVDIFKDIVTAALGALKKQTNLGA